MFKGKKIDTKRYISVIIIILFIVPAFFITSYGGRVGRIIGSIIFMIISIFAIYETLTAFGFHRYTSIITSLIIIPFFLINYHSSYNLFTTKVNTYVESWSKSDAITHAFKWEQFLILGIGSLIPSIAEYHIAKKKTNIFIMQIFISFIVFASAITAKAIWAFNSIGMIEIIYILLIPIISDTFGYFGGKYFSNYIFKGAKLAPKISPKKTWAGAIIGFILSFTFALLFGHFMGLWSEFTKINSLLMSAIMAATLSMLSPAGDLLFSAIKRKMDIKDFSNLLPGHGGIFDRIDSISIVTLSFVLTFILLI